MPVLQVGVAAGWELDNELANSGQSPITSRQSGIRAPGTGSAVFLVSPSLRLETKQQDQAYSLRPGTSLISRVSRVSLILKLQPPPVSLSPHRASPAMSNLQVAYSHLSHASSRNLVSSLLNDIVNGNCALPSSSQCFFSPRQQPFLLHFTTRIESSSSRLSLTISHI